MSNQCMTLAQRRRVGSGTKKAVLMYMADRASDDGSGIWTSKAHIAADTELSKRSVQLAMKEFEKDGIISQTGTKKCQNGFTIEYAINIDVLKTLPDTREKTGEGDSPVQEIHLTGAGDSPQGVQEIHPNHPLTTLEPPKAQAPSLFSEQIDQTEQDATFDQFWNVYPKKAGKPAARKAWDKAVKIASAATIIEGAARYANWLSSAKPGEFRPHAKHPQGWLSAGRWADEEIWRRPAPSWDSLTDSQRRMLERGECPPSMRLQNGEPNQDAIALLAQVAK